MAKTIRITSVDPSFRNWAYTDGIYDVDNDTIEVIDARLDKQPPPPHRLKSMSDFLRTKELWSQFMEWSRTSDVIMSELPTGSQSARAAKLLGMCAGMLSTICDKPLILVTPGQVKAVTGMKDPDKKQMIGWAHNLHKGGFWLTNKNNGNLKNDNEHIADSIAVMYAGVQTQEFKVWLKEQI